MLRQYWRLVRGNRNYRLLWLAQVISQLGDWFYTLAVYSLLLDLTGSKAQSVGLAVVLQVLPQTFAAPTAGVLNDRLSRKAIMIGADLARFLIVLGMLLARTPGTVWLVYPLLLFETVGAAFFEPAHTALIPNIVPEDQVLNANALSSITWSFCLAVGSALGGVTAALLGRDAVFVINALSFLASAWLIRNMEFREPHIAGAAFRARDLIDFRPVIEGIRYIRRDARILATVFVKGGVGLLGANNVLLPILGERVFPVRYAGLDPERGAMLGMSLLMAARGAGSLIGPLIGGWWAGESYARQRQGIVAGFLCAAAGYVALGHSAALPLAVLMVVLAHAGSSTNWVFSTTLLQIYSDDRFRGRVFSADLGICMLALSASSYLAGVAIDLGVTARAFAVVIGFVMLVPAVAWAAALRVTRPPAGSS
ncbi:MAG: MFS transporter [Acidobacteriia bacterium]|nr:MFS transporter [Terriglobia bacterium]